MMHNADELLKKDEEVVQFAPESSICAIPLWLTLAKLSQESARRLIPVDMARRYELLAVSLVSHGGEKMLMAVSGQEISTSEEMEIRFVAGCRVISEKSNSVDVLRAIEMLYGADDTNGNLVTRLLMMSTSCGATDLHIEPHSGSYLARIRVGGLLREITSVSLSSEDGTKIVRALKTMCALPHHDPRDPQDGSCSVRIGGDTIRLRCSFIPQIHGVKLAIRIFDDKLTDYLVTKPSLDDDDRASMFKALGVREEHAVLLSHELRHSGGAYLVCGPTGSGKTTLLHAFLLSTDRQTRNVVTLENPVERFIPFVNQVQYSSYDESRELLKSLLRQDIDAILLGEIREECIAHLFFDFAATGHQVFSSMHSSNCLEACWRLLQFGVSSSVIALAIRLIVSCRLVPKLCSLCRTRRIIQPKEARWLRISVDSLVYESSGCERCGGTGVEGQLGVYEFLHFTPAIRRLVSELSCDSERGVYSLIRSIGSHALREGYQPLGFQIRKMILDGLVSPDLARRVM